MAYQTFKKSGKKGKNPGKTDKWSDKDHSPSHMYGAVEFGGDRPGTERRFTNNYGKNAKARNEYKPEIGARSREAGRMFSWMKGESY
jgi:hypothetical protein